MKNKIYLHGSIGEDVKSSLVIEQINKSTGDLTVDISSNGGSVQEGTAIYNALLSYKKGTVTIEVTGWALSIASMIAMAGSRVIMHDTAILMVHKPHMVTGGNADELRKEASALDVAQSAFIKAYTNKTGLDTEQINSLLSNETWLDAESALKLGFIDEIATSKSFQKMAASVDLANFSNIPKWVTTMSKEPEPIQNKKPPKPAEMSNEMLAEMKAESIRLAGFERHFMMYKTKMMRELFTEENHEEYASLLINAVFDKTVSDKKLTEKIHDMLGRDIEPCELNMDNLPKENNTHPAYMTNKNTDKQNFLAAASDALAMRNGIKIETPHPAAHDIKNMGVPEIARNILRMSDNYNASSYSNSESIIKAINTTSDFPQLLSSLGGKSLQHGYDMAPITCREWTREHEVPDFKDQTLARLSEAPSMLEVAEGGEYKRGSFSESADTFKIKKWGRIFSITREALINDDLSAFTRLPHAFGQRAASLESDEVYSLLSATDNLKDGSPLFDASRGNLANSGSSLTVSSLGAARAEMRGQKGADGKSVIDIQPRFLIVPADLETLGEQLLSSLVDPAANNDTVNPEWIRSLRLISDPRLTGSAWYLSADPHQVETIIRAFLQGEERPFIEEKNSFETDDFSIKARLEFAAAIIDPKGISLHTSLKYAF
mgnify:CR=1 FL=1